MKTGPLFTPSEANRTLPLVKRIVSDILDTGAVVRAACERDQNAIVNDPQCHRLLARLQELLAELEAIGCVFKDYSFTVGLVDFPAMIDDRQVCLCWRSDESEIRYYHDVQTGYAGRQPIPETYLQPSTITVGATNETP